MFLSRLWWIKATIEKESVIKRCCAINVTEICCLNSFYERAVLLLPISSGCMLPFEKKNETDLRQLKEKKKIIYQYCFKSCVEKK